MLCRFLIHDFTKFIGLAVPERLQFLALKKRRQNTKISMSKWRQNISYWILFIFYDLIYSKASQAICL